VVQAPAAALAKRIRAALLAQTELRLKVKVRGEDGVEEEDDEGDAEVAQPDSAASGAPSAGASATTAPRAASGQAGPAATPPGSPSGTVAFTKTRLAWDTTRKKVQAELRKLEQAILAQCAAFPDAKEIAEGARNLYRILDYLDERLIDKLDEMLNAQSPADSRRLHAEAREIVDEYIDYVKSEELFADIDDNGFVPVAITSALNAALGAMARQLRAVTP
jgi:hypothetical protein